jgi:hypothetical protein
MNNLTYQIIQKGNGKYFVNLVREAGGSRFEAGAFDGYFNTYEEAFTNLQNIKKKHLQQKIDNEKTILYEEII